MEYPPIELDVAFQFICPGCKKKNFVSGAACNSGHAAMVLVPPSRVICNNCRTIYET